MPSAVAFLAPSRPREYSIFGSFEFFQVLFPFRQNLNSTSYSILIEVSSTWNPSVTHSVRSLSLLLFSNSFSFSLLHTFQRANHGFSLSFARGVNHGKRSSLFQNAFETRLLVPGIGVYAWNYGLARKKRAFENITRSRPKKGSQSFPPIPGQTRNTLFSSTLPPIVTKQPYSSVVSFLSPKSASSSK